MCVRVPIRLHSKGCVCVCVRACMYFVCVCTGGALVIGDR
jgi:hypothetical protein